MRLVVKLGKDAKILVEVVVPKSMNALQVKYQIPKFIAHQQSWLNKTIDKLLNSDVYQQRIQPCLLPETIELLSLKEVYSIIYEYSSNTSELEKLRLDVQQNNQLLIRGNALDDLLVFELLQRFFKQYARSHLKIKLDILSLNYGLPYNRLMVKAQKTRWGSCSAKKNINLNYRLLFIGEELMDYVLLHELVHTQHMNHSHAFWQQMEEYMPDARRRDKQLNIEAQNMPCWMER